MSLIESGVSQRKNSVYLLVKPLIQLCFGSIAFWAVGSALAYGTGNEIVGTEGFAFESLDVFRFPRWISQVCI